jgi:hypothetical protein
MFELTKEEFGSLRSQIATSKRGGTWDFRKELQSLDMKVNQIFKFLLEKIDALSQKQIDQTRRRIGYKRKDEE